MRRWWISWVDSDDARPLLRPSDPAIVGLWISGEYADGTSVTICALIEADARDVMAIVHRYWPEVAALRFCLEKPNGWIPGHRFPLEHRREQ
jgi:hypothetical protein